MRNWMSISILGLAATACNPDIPDPGDPPVYDTEGSEEAVPLNDCDNLEHPWASQREGAYNGDVEGYGEYVYSSASGAGTTISLRSCSEDLGATENTLMMTYRSGARLSVQEYNIHTSAEINDGDREMTFVYTVNDGNNPGTCQWEQGGTVNITKADGVVLEGDFEIWGKCRSDDHPERLKNTTFTGSFAAYNIGFE